MTESKSLLYEVMNIKNGLGCEVRLGYNADGELVEIRKIVGDTTYSRQIEDPDINDTTVDKWVKYKGWSIV